MNLYQTDQTKECRFLAKQGPARLISCSHFRQQNFLIASKAFITSSELFGILTRWLWSFQNFWWALIRFSSLKFPPANLMTRAIFSLFGQSSPSPHHTIIPLRIHNNVHNIQNMLLMLLYIITLFSSYCSDVLRIWSNGQMAQQHNNTRNSTKYVINNKLIEIFT